MLDGTQFNNIVAPKACKSRAEIFGNERAIVPLVSKLPKIYAEFCLPTATKRGVFAGSVFLSKVLCYY